jgi:Zn finger protein HypA/HybF involved in hydrogenase expression
MACGKVWHSLVTRENHITQLNKANSGVVLGSAMQSCGTCGMTGTGTQMNAQRNIDANTSDLLKLRSCPQCGSANFNEKIIDYAEPPKQIRR